MTSSQIITPTQSQKQEDLKDSPKKEELSPDGSPGSKEVKMSKRISDMKNFFESKQMGGSMAPKPIASSKMKQSEKKVEKKDDVVALHMCRDRVVVNLL